jgi:mannose-1-phosphate guanylyltransferase/phosphomannomutase
MGFIFPQLHPGFDAMFCIAKLIEMLLIQERSLGQIWEELPRTAHRWQTIRCPWTIKGALMRYLVEAHPAESLELVDGVKIIDPGYAFNGSAHNPVNDLSKPHQDRQNWVLVLPDASEPLVHIFANSEDRDWVDRQLQEYRQRVQQFIESEQRIKEQKSI